MSKTTSQLVAGACLIVGVLVGAAGAQVLQTWQRRFLNTGLFAVSAGQTARFHVTLDDNRGQAPAGVVLQVLDAKGAVVASRNAVLQPGESATLENPGPGLFRAHAEIVEPLLEAAPRRAVVGTVEVADSFTGVVRPVCSFDPVGIGGGRN
jgi:hypothetical protein